MNKYSNLDLDIIKDRICEFAGIEDARDYIREEDLVFNPLQIRKNVNETKEALKLLKQDFNVSFDGINNVNELLETAEKGIRLNGVELKNILVFHNHCERIRKLFEKLPEDLSIRDYTDTIYLSKTVFDQISDCIDPSGEVKEDASEKLKQISADLTRFFTTRPTVSSTNTAILCRKHQSTCAMTGLRS